MIPYDPNEPGGQMPPRQPQAPLPRRQSPHQGRRLLLLALLAAVLTAGAAYWYQYQKVKRFGSGAREMARTEERAAPPQKPNSYLVPLEGQEQPSRPKQAEKGDGDDTDERSIQAKIIKTGLEVLLLIVIVFSLTRWVPWSWTADRAVHVSVFLIGAYCIFWAVLFWIWTGLGGWSFPIAIILLPVMILLHQKRIPDGHIGLLKVNGLRQENPECILRERNYTLAGFFGKAFDLNIHDSREKDFDFGPLTESSYYYLPGDGFRVKAWFSGNFRITDLYTFDNIGGWDGLTDRLSEIIARCVESYYADRNFGPQTWEEAIRMTFEASYQVIKAIASRNALEPIPVLQDVPTETLLHYFNDPRPDPTIAEEKRWGKNWEGLDRRIYRLPANELAELRRVVGERRKKILALFHGKGDLELDSLGVSARRATFGGVQLHPDLEKAVSAKSKAQLEQRALQSNYEKLRELFPNLPDEDLANRAMALMGITTMSAQKVDVSGLPPGTNPILPLPNRQ